MSNEIITQEMSDLVEGESPETRVILNCGLRTELVELLLLE